MKRKVFGYAADGDARIYNLMEGESLPNGWRPDPYPGFERHWKDEREAKAEKLQEAPKEEVAGFVTGDLADIVAKQDKLALDQYAEKEGIKLDRRKSFHAMLSDYKDAKS